jgi:hypothetical protein
MDAKDLAPVLTGCHVCRSPLVELINKRMKDGMPDQKIAEWLKQEGFYLSRNTLGKHKRDHLTTPHESARINAVKTMEKAQKTIKANHRDLATLVRDFVFSEVESGNMNPTLSEGLRAQEMLDKRNDKTADRDLVISLAEILGGASTTYEIIEARPVEQVTEGS